MKTTNAVITKIVVAMLLVAAISFGVYKGRPDLFKSSLQNKVDSLKIISVDTPRKYIDTTKYELPYDKVILKNKLGEYTVAFNLMNHSWHEANENDAVKRYVYLTYDGQSSTSVKDCVVFNDSLRAVWFAIDWDTILAKRVRESYSKYLEQKREDSINKIRYDFKLTK